MVTNDLQEDTTERRRHRGHQKTDENPVKRHESAQAVEETR